MTPKQLYNEILATIPTTPQTRNEMAAVLKSPQSDYWKRVELAALATLDTPANVQYPQTQLRTPLA